MHCQEKKNGSLGICQPVPRHYLLLWEGDKALDSGTLILSTYPSLTHGFVRHMSPRHIQCVPLRPRVLQVSYLSCALSIGHTGTDQSWVSPGHPRPHIFIHPTVPLLLHSVSHDNVLSVTKVTGQGRPMGLLPLGLNVIPSWPLLAFHLIFAS